MTSPTNRRTPGVPGVLGDLQWVDTPDFGEKERRISRVYDLDPAPLARLLAVYAGLIDGEISDYMRPISDDDHNGPIHITHLLGACEYAARRTGGGLPGLGDPGDALQTIVKALRAGGFPAATAAVRALDRQARYLVLDSLLSYWGAPITALRIDLTDEKLRRS